MGVNKKSKIAVSLSKGPQKRKGFNEDGNVVCSGCFQKKLEIDDLKEENRKLRGRKDQTQTLKDELRTVKKELRRLQGIHRREQPPSSKASDAAHVPPSQRRFKKKSTAENLVKQGGGVKGHKGHGRSKVSLAEADQIIEVSAPELCSDCQVQLEFKEHKERTVLEIKRAPVKKTLYRFEHKKCSVCGKVSQGEAPIAPRALYGNSLLSKMLVLHFDNGVSIGNLTKMLGEQIKRAGVIAAFHRVAHLFQSSIDSFKSIYRQSPVKHADETGWRINGQSGWAWLFCTQRVSIFQHVLSRAQRIAQSVMGIEKLPGVLVVDRYNGYNRVPCHIQYCYAHLLREVQKLENDFKDSQEVLDFVNVFAPLLSMAMRLATMGLSHREFRIEAKSVVAQIQHYAVVKRKHQGIVAIQNIFQAKQHRLFQWSKSRDIPAHNNFAEREIRQTVISRKISLGSQSEQGATTRSIISSVLATAKKNLPPLDLELWIYDTLNSTTKNSRLNVATLIPFPKSVITHIH